MEIPFSNLIPVGVCAFDKVSGKLLNCRAKERLPENSRSIIVYLFPYYLGDEYYKSSNLSKYAVSGDYHDIVKNYLQFATDKLKKEYPQNSFEWFCDNSPIPEVTVAVESGLGVKGENGLLINKKYGSFCFIGEIVTDLKIPFNVATEKECLKCGACKTDCPGGALRENIFNKELCFSHLTQKKGELSLETISYIENNRIIWGCDKCQDACPMNKNISVTPLREFFETAKPHYNLGDLISGRAFSWRGEEVINRNLKIMCCKDEKNKL